MAVSDVTCGLGVKQQHQVLNVREVGLQVFLVHPVVVEVGMTGLGRGERRPEEPVAGTFRQVQERPPPVRVPAVEKPVAGAAGLEGLAGRAPELLASLDRVASRDLPLGVLEELEGQAGVLLLGCFVTLRHAWLSSVGGWERMAFRA